MEKNLLNRLRSIARRFPKLEPNENSSSHILVFKLNLATPKICQAKNLSSNQRVMLNGFLFRIGPADTLIPSSFIYLIYMGGTGPCDLIKIIFGYHFNNQHIILNIKFGVNRMFHVVKTTVYRFDIYGRYQTLWTDDDNFWQCYLELIYKPKYQIWCEADVPCAQDPSLPV